ncbi:MAG TPA: hypothetical protein DD727_08615 [Clostridiales bacterium]|nr:hypothetical protein [Clostridiales bacterium]
MPAIGAAFFNNFVQAMVAGVSYGDVVQSNTQYVAVSSKNNYISALEGYFNMDSPLFNDPRVRFGNWNGHWYGLREQIATPRHTITYNRLIFEQSGVESPYEAYKRGQWTWSTMIEMGMQTTRDLNGDAIIDQWGLDTWKNSGLPLATIYFLPSNGADAAEFDSNGRLQVTLTTPAAMEAIEFVRSLSSTYNVMPASNKAGEFYQRNLAAMYLGNPQSVTVQLKMDTYGTHGIVSYPVGPRMEGKKMPEGTVGEYFFAVPYNVPESDKKAIARILVDLNAVWNKNIEPYLDTDEYYRDLYKAWDDGTENMEMLIEMGKRQQPLAAAYNSTLYNPITLNLFNDIFLNNLSTASAVDKYKPMIVDAINAMY